MQRWFAVLIGTMYVASADAGETVAGALASAVQFDHREYFGLRAGDGYWQLSGEYTSAGVVYRRASAEFGIAVGFAEFARSGIRVADREDVYEMSWRIELSERFALQSDLQYIRNPGMDATIDSSWTIGLRFELSAR